MIKKKKTTDFKFLGELFFLQKPYLK